MLKAAFVKFVGDDVSREELIDAVETLERTSFLGGFLGLMAGAISAVNFFNQPSQVGPNLHVAFTSLLYCLFLNALFALPLKHQLLREANPSIRLTPRAAWLRATRIAATVVVVMVAVSMWPFSEGYLGMFEPSYGLLYLVAVIGPSALAASDSVLMSPTSERRQFWYADALVCGGVIALSCGFMHLCSVLDQPALLAPGMAWVLAVSVPPMAAAALARLASPHAELRVSETERFASRNLYGGFAGFAVASLLALMGLVFFLCLDSMEATAAAPR